jgi:hypothetical protein
MVTHSVLIPMTGQSNLTVQAAVIRVTRASDLLSALAQRTAPVIIDSKELEPSFARLERWQSREKTYRFIAMLIATLLAYAISQRYRIDVSWHTNFKLERIDGKITLTPSVK